MRWPLVLRSRYNAILADRNSSLERIAELAVENHNLRLHLKALILGIKAKAKGELANRDTQN